MSRLLSVCLLPLLACVAEEEPASLPEDAVAPPISLTFGPLVRGAQTTFGVLGANPGDNIFIVRSTAGPGSGPCPPPLQGLCVDVLSPVVTLQLTANNAGNAQRTITLPADLPLIAISFQAFAVGSSGAFESPVMPGQIEGELSYALDVQPIFDQHCVSCHSPPGASLGLDLETDGYGELVNQPSTQSGLDLVLPGDRTQSYLWHKIAGTQTSVGGNGSRMPRGGAALPTATRNLIGQWIDDGAAP
jgi:hypothetical protein